MLAAPRSSGRGKNGGVAVSGPLPLDKLRRYASLCHTPVQFKRLLKQLRDCIPYCHLVCGWGNPTTFAIVHVVDIDYPRRFIQWYLTKGMLRKDPVFLEWIRTGRPQKWFEVARRIPHAFDPEYVKKIEEFHLQYTMGGGVVDKELAFYFSLAMRSEEECHAHIKTFSAIVPFLYRALKASYRHPSLTERKKTILWMESLGDSHKQIAGVLGITERTVKMHLEDIRKKLYAENVKNAIAIALRTGVIE